LGTIQFSDDYTPSNVQVIFLQLLSQVLSDCIEAADKMKTVNERKSFLLKTSALFFVIQIGSLLVLALLV